MNRFPRAGQAALLILALAPMAWPGEGRRAEVPIVTPGPTPVTQTPSVGNLNGLPGTGNPSINLPGGVNQVLGQQGQTATTPANQGNTPVRGAVPIQQGSSPVRPGGVRSDVPGVEPAVGPGSQRTAPGEKPARGKASGSLEGSVRQIKKGQEIEAKAPSGEELGVGSALKKIFDGIIGGPAMTRGSPAASQNDPSPGSAVQGKTQPIQEKIVQTAEIANAASPHDAPDLYRSAIQTARDAAVSKLLSPAVAEDVGKTVLRYARSRAESALTTLANGAYQAAAVGAAGEREVKRALGSLDKWEGLLGSPGRPLIENAQRLKADIRRVQAQAAQAIEGAKTSSPKVWLERKGSAFIARLPASSVARLPGELALGLAIQGASLEPPLGSEEALAAYRRDPSLANASRLVWRFHHQAGRSAARSFFVAARYWAKAALAQAWHRVADWAASLLDRRTGEQKAAEESAEMTRIEAAYASALRRLSRSPSRLAEVDRLLEDAAAMSDGYRRMSRDASGAQAVLDLRRRIESEKTRLGLGPQDAVPPTVMVWVTGEGHTLRHWIESLHGAAERRRTGGAPRLASELSRLPGQAPRNKEDVSAVLGPLPYGQATEGDARSLLTLVSYLKRDPREAAATAERLGSLPSSAFLTVGSVIIEGREFLAQRGQNALSDGSVAQLAVLRDAETGQLVYGRAEASRKGGRPGVLPAKALPGLLAH